jgi:hypothetical protein
VLVCAALGSCSLAPSPRAHPAAAPQSRVAVADSTHEYPGRPVRERVAAAAVDAVAAVRGFARAYINWSAATVSADMRALALRSVGQARSIAQLAAAQTAQDYELQRGGVANQGTVEAVAPLSGHAHQYVVVTLERTTATSTSAYQGLAPAWHVAVATASEVGVGRWAVSGWQPES